MFCAAGRIRRFEVGALAAALLLVPALQAEPPQISIRFDRAVRAQPFSGRVYVFTSSDDRREPRHSVNWFHSEPFFSLEVNNWSPGEALVFDAAKAKGFPAALADLPAGTRRFQAVLDFVPWSHRIADAPGNAYSDIVQAEHHPDRPACIALEITKLVKAGALDDTETRKYVRLKSDKLSEFHHRDVFLQAAVFLPESYESDGTRRYPSIYEVPGFGGTIEMARWMERMDLFSGEGLEIVRVFLDADCPTGHHVFADSANNGPVGAALVQELIPHIEKQFRIIADSRARYVTGHSSGGWSSLWLQLTYPDTFGGVWSLAPDPVDFSAFQRVNIYDPADSMYVEPDGSPRALSRPSLMGILYTRPFSAMEEVLGRGGQLQSFEAVFSPRGPDGRPAKLWDRATGALDPQVAAAWKKYDIADVLRTHWSELAPKLAGKLHVFCGDQDTFFLDLAVLRLRDELKRLGSDARVVMVPNADHGLTMEVRQQVAREVAETFRRFEKATSASP